MEQLMLNGRMTADPELKIVKVNNVDTPVVNFNLAENLGQGKTKFWKLTAWRGAAENLAKYGSKGRMLAIIANNIDYELYEKEDGVYANLIANVVSFEFCDANPNKDEGNKTVKTVKKIGRASSVVTAPTTTAAAETPAADEIPFNIEG